MQEYPGAVLSVADPASGAFTVFENVLRVTGGVTLSQLCEMTGLEPSTVQNWVRRGWVPKPEEKRYGERQVARVLILNALRGALQLESIIVLLHSVNGNLDDTADDLLPDRQLYEVLCRALSLYEEENDVISAVDSATAFFNEPYRGAAQKLKAALYVMLPAYRAAVYKRQAEAALEQIEKEK